MPVGTATQAQGLVDGAEAVGVRFASIVVGSFEVAVGILVAAPVFYLGASVLVAAILYGLW